MNAHANRPSVARLSVNGTISARPDKRCQERVMSEIALSQRRSLDDRSNLWHLEKTRCRFQNERSPMVRNVALGMTVALGVALTAPVAMAQEKHHVSYDTPATQTTYTQQHVIDVGDIPGHQARLFEIRRIYGDDAPIINGSKLKEQWTRGMSDYIDNNGPALIYNVWILENGEKFFVRTSLVAQSSEDGKLTNMTSGSIT